MSFEEWVGVDVEDGICFGGWADAEQTLEEGVVVVVREEDELNVAGVDFVEQFEAEVGLGVRTGGVCFTG